MALNSNFRTLTADNIEGIVEDRNYLKSSFENGTITGWREMAVTVDANGFPNATPTIGTDASPNAASSLSLSATSTTPLSGTRSLLVTVPTSLSQGQGFISEEFTLDRMDLGKVLTVSFDYERISGTYNFSGTRGSQTWMVYIYDATAGGATWIQPAGFLGMNQSSGPGRVACTFQTSVTAGQKYRVAVIASQAAAGASSIEFDNFTCSRQTAPIGPVVTDTLNAGAITIGATVTAPTKGTRTADSVSWMRIGDSAYFSYQYNQTGAGAAGSGDYLISLPSGMSFDSNKVSFYTGGLVNFSALVPYGLPDAWFGWGQSPGTNSYGLIIPYDSTRFRVAFEYVSASGPVATGGLFWGSGGNQLSYATVSFNATFQVPISGWSSNVQRSSDTDTRVVSFVGSINAQGYTSLTTNLAMTVSKDSHGAFSSGVYTIPVSGDYSVNATVISDQANFFPTVYLNGGIYTYGTRQASASQATTAAMLIPNLKAGDTISLRIGNTNGNTIAGGYFSINRLSGPSVVAASETVSFSANTSTTAGSTTQCFIYTVKDHDTHNAYSTITGKFTVPVSGKYAFGGYAYFNAVVGCLVLYKNGSVISQGIESKGNAYPSFVSAQLNLVAGDVIELRPTSSVTAGGQSTVNSFYGNRIGQ